MKYETVTPAMAEAMMRGNSDNRSLRKYKVAAYAADMKAGRWRHRASSQILIHRDGRLLNGQHRLAAVIESGVAVPMLIVRGCEDSDRAAIDVGASRTSGDMAKYLGVRGGSKAGAMLTLLWQYTDANLRGHHRPTPPQMEALLIQHKDRLADVMELCGVHLPMPQSMVGFIGLCVIRTAPEMFGGFVHGLATGEGLAAGDARLTLRNHFLLTRARVDLRHHVIERIVRGWNAYAQGRALSNSQVGRSEDFPDIYQSEFPRNVGGAR